MKAFSAGERLWLAALLGAAVLLGVKSYVLDPWTPETTGEAAWYRAAQEALAQEPPSWGADRGLLQHRIVEIRQTPSPEDGDAIRVTVRTYVLGYLPFGDRRIILPAGEK